MYTPTNILTKEILSIFITRVGVILSNIQKRPVHSYNDDTLIFSVNPNGGPCIICLLEPGESDTIIMWDNSEGGYSNLRTNNKAIHNLSVNDGLAEFTRKEQKVMARLIELEKEEADKVKIADYFEMLRMSQEPLGDEFEKVLEENLDKLYEN